MAGAAITRRSNPTIIGVRVTTPGSCLSQKRGNHVKPSNNWLLNITRTHAHTHPHPTPTHTQKYDFKRQLLVAGLLRESGVKVL